MLYAQCFTLHALYYALGTRDYATHSGGLSRLEESLRGSELYVKCKIDVMVLTISINISLLQCNFSSDRPNPPMDKALFPPMGKPDLPGPYP